MRNPHLLIAGAMCASLLTGCDFLPGGPPPPPPSPGELLAAGIADPGEAAYVQWCMGCHAPLPEPGPPGPGGFPPAGTAELQRRYQGRLPATLTDRTDLTPAAIRSVVRSGRGIMPPTRKSEMTDEELDALTAWLARD